MISVIMGVYNGQQTVAKSIQSILDSDYTNFEFIIVDDGSQDNSAKIIEDFANKDDRIVFVQNKKNRGLTYSLNRALQVAKGEFIARQDADDFSYPNRFNIQLSYLLNHKEVDFVGAAAKLVDIEGKMWGTRYFPTFVDKNDILKYNPFIHPTLLIRKKALEDINGYRDIRQTVRCEDYDLIFRLYANGSYGINIPKILLDYYEDKDSAFRHSFKTRYNEHYVKSRGSKAIKGGIKGYLMSYKPIVLAFLNKRTYNKLHNQKWKDKNEMSADILYENFINDNYNVNILDNEKKLKK